MPSVGEQLRAAREAKKLTIEQLADQTKIRGDHLRALESGAFNVFSAPVYVKGFTRTYATALKLDAVALVQQLEKEMQAGEAFPESPMRVGEEPARGEPIGKILQRINWPIAIAVLVVLLVGAIIVTLVRNYRAELNKDPLKEIGPGLYTPKPGDPGQYLPIPTNTPPGRR